MSGLKLFHASDLHFNAGYFDYILTLQDKFDIFCFSGDFLCKENEQEKEQATLWLKSFKKSVFVCSGNHDMPPSWLKSINGIYADGAIKTINGVKFGCVPYLCDDLIEFAECDILLTHVPPAKTKTSIGQDSKDYGDMELARLIKNNLLKAKIILCGHIHEPKSHMDILNGVKIYNSASNGTKEPFYQEIEL
ncbi:metallophosphoesterase [Campylobacter concisus]|uniref:Metallophosphoesterase n=1 Tax=Campylobacter concisus TaxID=199 RepID=A0AAE7P207_9BACT|nr:metallophosphoesterase [Campylobacter concisus]QPH85513.1 metallophosphoesterase [Campylobacter concisus]